MVLYSLLPLLLFFANLNFAKSEYKSEVVGVISQFVVGRNWKSLSLITDYADPVLLVKHFSSFYLFIEVSVHLQVIQRFNIGIRPLDHVVVWCRTSSACYENLAKDNSTFYKSREWLMVFQDKQDFINCFQIFSPRIRADSTIYILMSNVSAYTNWMIYKIDPSVTNAKSTVLKKIGKASSKTSEITIDHDQVQQLQHRSIQGFNVSVVEFPFPQFDIFLKNGMVTGFRSEVLRILANYLKFRINTILLSTMVTGHINDSSSWTQSIRMIRNSSADVHGFGFPVTPAYMTNADISAAFLYTFGQAAIIRNSILDSRTIAQSYTQPFDRRVWLYTILLFALLIFMCILTANFSSTSLDQNTNKFYKTVNVIIGLFLHISALSTDGQKSKWIANNIFINIVFCFTLLISIFYSTTLTAALAADKNEIPYKSLHDLVRSRKFTFVIQSNISTADLIQKAKTGVYAAISKNLEVVNEIDDALRKVQKGWHAFIYPFVAVRDLDCNYFIVKKQESPLDLSFAFQKNSPLMEMFTIHTMRVRSSGILGRLNKDFLSSKQTSCETIQKYTVNVHQTIIVFYLLEFGIALSFIIFVLEILLSIVFANQ